MAGFATGQPQDPDKKFGAVVNEIQPGLAAAKAAVAASTEGETVSETVKNTELTVPTVEVAAPLPSTAVSNTDRTKAELAAEAKARARRRNKVLTVKHYENQKVFA